MPALSQVKAAFSPGLAVTYTYRNDGPDAAPGDQVLVAMGARVVLDAHLADGSSLPTWLSFNAVTGTFSGAAPLESAGSLDIEIIARDEEGRIARVHFSMDLEAKAAESREAAKAEQPGEQVQQKMYDKADADKDVADAAKTDADTAKTAKIGAEKPVKQGAAKFSEQARVARTGRDPVLASILAEKTTKVEKRPV